MSHHSHEIGLANLPFTRRGRKAAVQQDKDRSKRAFRQSEMQDSSISNANASAGPSNPTFSSTLSMIAPLPGTLSQQEAYTLPQSYALALSGLHDPTSQERWDRMGLLFHAIREHARTFAYPGASVAALEGVLIRMFLESPMPGGQQQVQATNSAQGGNATAGEMNGDVS
jgi:hypothetical protein